MREQEKAFHQRNAVVILVEHHEAYRIRYLIRQAKRKKKASRPIDKIAPNVSWLDDAGKLVCPVVTDPGGAVWASYGLPVGNPGLFLIDKSGLIRWVAHYRDIQNTQATDVLNALDDLEEKRQLIAALKDADPKVANASALLLRPIGPKSKAAVPALRTGLSDDRAEVRAGAAAGLCWLGYRADGATGALAKALQDDDPRVRRLSAEGLARIGPAAKAAIPALIRALNAEDERLRRQYARRFRRRPPSSRLVFPPVAQEIGLRHDDHLRIRSMLVAALERMGAAATPLLIAELKSANPKARINAAELLGRLRDDGAPGVRALVKALRSDEDPRVREAAVYALSEMMYYGALPLDALDAKVFVDAALKDDDPTVRAMTLRAVNLKRWDVLVAVVAALDDQAALVRSGALYLLDHRADTSVPTTLKALGHRDAKVRTRAARVLGQLIELGTKRTKGRLIHYLAEQAPPVLRKALEDSNAEVRKAAAESMKKLEAMIKLRRSMGHR